MIGVVIERICQLDSDGSIDLGRPLYHLGTKRIDGILVALAETEGGGDFLASGARRTSINHTEHVSHTQRRDHYSLVLSISSQTLTEEIKGEIIATACEG